MKKIIRYIYQKLKFTVFNDVNLEQSTLCGVSIKTVRGTIRKKTDQDDAWFFHLATNNEIIFDIGANVGYTALLAMIQNPDRRYILVDPNPLALTDANKNLLMNSLGNNSSYIPAFVADKKGGEVKFYTVGTGAAGSFYKSHAKTAVKLDSWFYVNTTTLDFLYKYYNVIPDLVKIDVEGAESLVLDGANILANECNPLFMVEMHANEELSMSRNVDKIINWCKINTYNAWYMKEERLLNCSKEISHRGKCHLLLIPKGNPYPDYLIGIKQSASLPKCLNT